VGSVLGPLLFLLYTAELFSVTAVHGVTSHFYTDGGQLYVNCPAADAEVAIRQLQEPVWLTLMPGRKPEPTEDATDLAGLSTAA